MDDETIEGRFELHDERLDHYGERIDKLEAAQADKDADEKHAEGMRINWIVVALFAVELVLGAWQVWWVMRRA